MTRNIIDLSIAIENNVASDPPGSEPKIVYHYHKDTVEQMARFFPGLNIDDMPDGEGWAIERLDISTHNGTHMDAPWHFHSTTENGVRRAPSIDETPLNYCFRPGVKLDFRRFPDGHVVSANEVEEELQRINYIVRPLDIVLINTRAGSIYGQPGYVDAGCGMSRDATLYLTERGVKVVGTDAWSWDAPFSYTAKRWAKERNPKIIWEGHKAGREIPYWQMEKLHNLEILPAIGFDVSCFPVKIRAASAGWTRAVAIIYD